MDRLNKPTDEQNIWNYFSSPDFIESKTYPELDELTIFKRMRITCFSDLVAAVALARPIADFVIVNFLTAKETYHKNKAKHPLNDILAETYGFLLYQEQIISIAYQIGGFTHDEAGNFRVALAKIQRNLIPEYKRHFLQKAVQKKITKKRGEEIFDMMEEYAPFAFRRSYAKGVALKYYRIAECSLYS